MNSDVVRLLESAGVSAGARANDSFREVSIYATLEKYDASQLAAAGQLSDKGRRIRGQGRGVAPYETVRLEPGNLLMFGGGAAFWDLLIGAANVTAFNNGNAYLGVGISNTAAAATQTDLQGASKDRQGMEATYPLHTDGVTSGSEDCVFKSSWATGDGNFAWEEWGLFNASTAGRMLQRKVESLGTKTSASVWELTVTLSLA